MRQFSSDPAAIVASAVFVHRANIWRPKPPVNIATKEPFDSIYVQVAQCVPCFYSFTENLDDPIGIGRGKRPTAFTRDIIVIDPSVDIQDQDLVVNVTGLMNGRPNALFAQCHRVQGEAKVSQIPGTGINVQSLLLMVENKPPQVVTDATVPNP